MTADVEDEYVVAQATEPLDEERQLRKRPCNLPSAATSSSRSTAEDVDSDGRFSEA